MGAARAGMRALLADDDPHAPGPGRQAEQAGELGAPALSRTPPSLSSAGIRARAGILVMASPMSVMVNPTEYCSRRPGRVSQVRN